MPTDKVFGPASVTETVYEEGVKNVALSSLMGINGNASNLFYNCKTTYFFIPDINWATFFNEKFMSCLCVLVVWTLILYAATIFAYGQTSSGKTFTMRGITEKAVTDIYNHIMNVRMLISFIAIYKIYLDYINVQS